MIICPFCSLCATEFEKFQMTDYSCPLLIFSFTEIMWAHGGDKSLWWSLHWEATKKTDTSKGDYYFIICSPVLFLLFFFVVVLFCFVFFFLLLLLLLVLLYIYCIFCLVSLTVIFTIYRFFSLCFLRRRKWMWTVQQRWMQPRLYQYRRKFLLQMPNRFSVEQKGDLRG